jgi:hypothetical protein
MSKTAEQLQLLAARRTMFLLLKKVGGKVVISRSDLEGFDPFRSKVKMSEDKATGDWTLEAEIDSQVSEAP